MQSPSESKFSWWNWDMVALLLPVIAMANRLYFEALSLWSKQHLQFFPLAFLAAAWFFYQEGAADSPVRHPRLRFAKFMVLLGYLGVGLAVIGASSWIAHATLVWMVFWWAIGKFSQMTPLRILGICGLLLVTIPIPFGWDHSLTQFLQLLSSTCCSRLMDLSWMLHVPLGNVIETPVKPLFVEEACSGVDSQYALMAVAGVLLLVGQAPLWVSSMTIVTVPIWAILGNLLRIYCIAFGLEFLGIDLSSGTQHTLLGLATFSVAAYAHWSSVQFLNFLDCKWGRRVVPSDPTRVPDSSPLGSATNSPEPPLSWAPVIVAGLFAGSLVAFGIFEQRTSWGLPRMTEDVADQFPGRDDLPVNANNLTMTGFASTHRERYDLMGQHSRTWQYEGNDLTSRLSLDMPFRGWHPVSQCYANSGWTLLALERIEKNNLGAPLDWPFFEARLENPFGAQAVLFFCQFDEFGNPYPSSSTEGVPEVKDRWYMLKALVRRTLGRNAFQEEPVTYQLQFHTMTKSGLAIADPFSLREAFLELRSQVYHRSMPVIESLRTE